MKILRQGLALAVLGAGLTAVSPLSATAAPAAPDRTLVQRMQDDASGQVRVSDERATGKISFIRATGSGSDLLPGTAADSAASAVDKAEAYVDEFAPAFGAPSEQLVREGVTRDELGTVVTWTQEYDGVPVFGSMLKAHLDDQGDLTAVNGELVPVQGLSTDPAISAAEAGRAAVAMVKAQPPTDDEGKAGSVAGIEAKDPSLLVYRSGLAQGVAGGENELAYSIEVGNDANVRDMVFVDAQTGKILNRYSLVHGALERELYEADQNRNLELVWQEGDPLPGDLNTDQENLVRSTGESYWLFKNAFGRDSYDGAGAVMRTINNDPAIACPNANWNGTTTNYCDGVTSDDVVSHEWGHAYTEYTHGLIYQWQPGALNEGYSDVFGETLDLINGREDEGEGDISSPRPVDTCSTNSPAKPVLTINAPGSIARDCLTGGASFGEQLTAEGITGDVVAPTDEVEPGGGTALDGCSPYEQDVTGKIVLVDRGLCAFTEKAEMATEEGAAALIIGNRDDAPIGMSGDDQSLVATVSIGLTDREAIRTALTGGEPVNVTMKDAGGERTSSFRWLVGEKSGAFGGAIRDMWNPTCYGDPGKVSDAEYKCSTDDNGGVHSNSGVVNRGYSLLVDGGDYNGVEVGGIGLDKSLNIYYKAMLDYQTPASDFVDHANSLEASCADLTGKAINELSTEPNDVVRAVDKITADDCAQVAAMAQAVELRLDPTDKCNFEPLLAPGDPGTCGEGFTGTEVFSEDFENGLDAWTLEGDNVYGGETFPWTTTRTYRGDHESTVAFAPGPDEGDCSATASDISSVDWMTSGDIELPADGTTPRMSFEHYVATELGFDGGNVQVAVDGGEFAPVPAEAFAFNAPDQISTEAEGNTNPLAGQPGFTGTDGGSVFGSWGTSVVDLGQAGVAPGDTIQVRFAMGRDGCGGSSFFGWNVDNIAVALCEEVPAEPVATTTTFKRTIPQPVRTGKPFVAKVKVVAEDGSVPSGQVALRSRGRIVGTDGVNARGVALIESTRRFARPGTPTMTAVFQGGELLEKSSDRFTVRVVRR